MNPNIYLKRPREEKDSVEESPLKKQKTVDVSSYLGRLKKLSLVSPEDFPARIVEVTQLFGDLQEALSSHSEAKAQIQSAKTSIKFIQSRIQEVSGIDKSEVLGKIEGILLSLKAGGPNVFKISVNIPPNMLSLVNPNKALIESLWTEKQVEVVENENGSELTFSDKLRYTIDDYQLELILKNSSESIIKSIKYFDFNKYPHLSSKAVALIVDHCPNLKRKSFQGIASSQFCDHTLLIENGEILINKAFLCHFSPYFQMLFTSKMKEGSAVENGISVTVLDMDLEPVRDCIHALIGMYDISKERKINRILPVIHYLELFQIESFEAVPENAVINTLDMMKFSPLEELEQNICDINKLFYPYFSNGKFLGFSKKLEELSKSIVAKLLEPITMDFNHLRELFIQNRDMAANSQKYNEVLRGAIPILKDLNKKQMLYTGMVEFLESYIADSFFEKNFFFNEKIDTFLLTTFLEELHRLDPMNALISAYLGVLYKATINQGDKYQKVLQLLKRAAQKEGLEDSVTAQLSEVLLTGATGHEPNAVEAKKVLEQKIGKNPMKSFQSRIALANLLTEGKPERQQIEAAYHQLVPLLHSINDKINFHNGLSVVEVIVLKYFQFLMETKGFIYPENQQGSLYFMNVASRSEENSVEIAAIELLSAIYRYGRDEALNHVIKLDDLTTLLPVLERTPFYRIALQAIEVFREAKQRALTK